MRIVVDLQSCQSESRFRGIGRYSLSLAKAIVRRATEHEIWLVLSDRYPDKLQEIRRQFEGLVPRNQIAVFSVPAGLAESDPRNLRRARLAERLRENFIAGLRPDIVHLFSLFEGWVDEVVSSVGILEPNLVTSTMLYDLIPLLRSDEYLMSESMRAFYYRKLRSLKNADLLLTISEASRQDAVDVLTIPEERVINVSAGVDETFRPLKLSADEVTFLCRRYGITRPFVFCAPGGFDTRKNIAGLIAAYGSLSVDLRKRHQLVIASKIPENFIRELRTLAKQAELTSDDVQLVGYVPESDLVRLYNSCRLFVLPSLYEGLGLPALEAMACGAPVIASGASSLPELIACREALFDPQRRPSMAKAIGRALEDEEFRQRLVDLGLKQAQKFKWEESARKAVEAFESIHARQTPLRRRRFVRRFSRPRLAFVSPLPPERTGIAKYASEVLQELGRFYEIDLIVDQPVVEGDWLTSNFPVRPVEWLETHARRFDRILYQFGNSPFHKHMPDLLQRYPGVVTLHDFFLSGLFHWMEEWGSQPRAFQRELHRSHGYQALLRRQAEGVESVVRDCPCSRVVFDFSVGTIVHSDHARRLALEWYGCALLERCRHIPMLRATPPSYSKGKARQELGIRNDKLVVCSFGLLDPTKLNHRLLEAWLNSQLAKQPHCWLIFVGENHGGDYGRKLNRMIERSPARDRIQITGFESPQRYSAYLAAADVAVQLRCQSRGETSSAVLDCLVNGAAMIINASGSMAEYPDNVLIKLEKDFADHQLVAALEQLMEDAPRRQRLGEAGRNYVLSHHHPHRIGDQYHRAIEEFTATGREGRYRRLIRSISDLNTESSPQFEDLPSLAERIAFNSSNQAPRKLLVDVSGISALDLKTGTERVTRSILLSLLQSPPTGFRVEPVYAGNRSYHLAGRFTSRLLKLNGAHLDDPPVEFGREDIFLGLDWAPEAVERCYAQLNSLFRRGVQVNFVVYDILPLVLPERFPDFMRSTFERWLSKIAAISEGIVCISRTVADDVQDWLSTQGWTANRRPRVSHFHLGADIESSSPAQGTPPEPARVWQVLSARKSFLMVGTVEPRKGHLQTLRAFDRLWEAGVDVNLIVVGKEGWNGLEPNQRRPVAELANELRQHPQTGNRLHWLDDVSDEFLQQLYSGGTALIAASEGEGFGLPLIEASRHRLPIIARDLPVFREVVGRHAFYFEGDDQGALADCVQRWLELYESGDFPRSEAISWLTWEESTRQLMERILA